MTKYSKKTIKVDDNVVKNNNVDIPLTIEQDGNVVKPIVKSVVKPIVKKTITLPISEWKDLEVLTNRIKVRYGATLKSKNESGAIFEGDLYIVELNKLDN